MKALATINNTAVVEVESFGDNVIQEFLASKLGRAETTLRTYRNALRQLFRFFSANKITAPSKADVQSFISGLQKKSQPTQRLYCTVTKNFFAWLAREGYYMDVAANIDVRLEKEKTHAKKALNNQQAQKLLASVTGETVLAIRDRAIVALCLTAGLRTCEVSRADVEDLESDGCGGYFLSVQGKGKKSKGAKVRVAPTVSAIIDEYLSVRGEVKKEFVDKGNKQVEVTPLFSSESHSNRGVRLSVQSVGKMLARRMKAAGVHKAHTVTAHSTRHYCATQAIKAGVDLREVSAMLRHSNLNVTMTYLHDLEVENRRAEFTVAASLFGGAA
ncbi:MAG: tyrosine-type recombinase/integrase [Selenomonadaceae bacterium]|nr:tyrosine-type recombinase/integrase [Selenomonadaceae bacterium]